MQDYIDKIQASQARNDYKGAFAEARAFEGRVKASFGTRHIAYAIAMAYLGQCSVDLGVYAQAEQFYRRGASLAEQLRDPMAVALIGEVATALRRQGRYAEAEALARRAVALAKVALKPDDPDAVRVAGQLADILNEEGRYVEAEAEFRRVLARREGAPGSASVEVGVALTGLGNAILGQGRARDAEPLYRRALSIAEAAMGADHADVAINLVNLANDLERQGRPGDAEPLFRRALAIRERTLGPAHPDVGAALTYLSSTVKAQGRPAEAEPLERRALAIRQKALGAGHPDVAWTLNNLGSTLTRLDRSAEAEPLYRQALAIREAALGPNHVEVGLTLGRLGATLQATGRLTEAGPPLRRALTIEEAALGEGHPQVTLALSRLAFLDEARGDTGAALGWSRRALASLLARPDARSAADTSDPVQDTGFTSRTDLLLRHVRLLSRAAKARTETAGTEPADSALREAFETGQRVGISKAAAALNQMTARAASGGDALAALIRQLQDLADARAALDRRLLAALGKPASAQDRASIDALNRDLAARDAEIRAGEEPLRRDFPRYADLARPQPVTVAEAQALLGTDEALVYLLTGAADESYAFAITRETAAWTPIALGGEALVARVAEFRRGLDVDEYIASVGEVQFDLQRSRALHAALLEPLAGTISAKRHLVFVPTGALTALPFHLLVTAAFPEANGMAAYRDAPWLIRDHAISILPSVDSLKALRGTPRRAPASRALIGFGDPVFDPAPRVAALEPPAGAASERDRSRAPHVTRAAYSDLWRGAEIDRSQIAQALPALPETAEELRAVAARLGAPESDLYLGGRATETAVKAAPLAEYRVVYFATHGLVAGEIRGVGEPSLALTQPRAPTQADDGFLTASEAAQLHLNADWVVLSACNTIAGDRPGAEALSGLVRAFFYAGARAMLVSHWAASSSAATQLTTKSFALMSADPGLGRSDALRRAMLDYLDKAGEGQNAYPAFWAPFAVVGEGTAR